MINYNNENTLKTNEEENLYVKYNQTACVDTNLLSNESNITADYKKPKLKTEILQDKIYNIQERINKLKEIMYINEENKTVKIDSILQVSKSINSQLNNIEQDNSYTNKIELEIKNYKNSEGLLLLALSLFKSKLENKTISNSYNQIIDENKNLKQTIKIQKQNIDELLKNNNELFKIKTLQEENIENLKNNNFSNNNTISSNKLKNKFEIDKISNKLFNDPNIIEGYNMNNNLWDRENVGYDNTYMVGNSNNIEDFAKDKNLWIGNQINNINSSRINKTNDNNISYGNINKQNNMSRYGNMILSKKN